MYCCSAFFPLSSQSLESFPLGEYKGISNGATIIQDPVFGATLKCQASDQDEVALDPVPYGANGPFSINLWVKPDDLSGLAFSYLLSHRGIEATDPTGWGPNQVQMYMPQSNLPAYGVVRAYVRDGDDFYRGDESEGYVDSDGSVGFNGQRPENSTLLDGQFHMITMTSQPTGGKGYVMYVDGKVAVQMREGTTYLNEAGVPLNVRQRHY